MSTGVQDKGHLPHGKRSSVENDTSHSNQHSALFYILQEVSKLPSPIHNSFLDTDPTSTWLNETSRQGPFIVKKQEAEGHSFEITHTSFQHNSPHVAPHNQVKKIKEESQARKVRPLIEPHPGCKSTWKVLSLINLHCQKLRHHSDVEESDSSSVSAALDQPTGKSSTASVDVTDQGDGGDFMLVEYSYRPSVLSCEREETPACGSPAKDMKACSGGAGSFKMDFCVKHTKVGSRVDSLTVEKLDNVRAEVVEENGRASSEPHYREQKETEDKNSVNGQSEWNPEYKKDYLFSEQDILNVLVPEHAPSPVAPTISRITLNSDVDTHLALSKPALILDHNANLALTTEALCDAQLCPTSSVPTLFSMTEKCCPVPNQGHKVVPSKQEGAHTPLEENSPLVVQVASPSYKDEANSLPSATSEPEPRADQNKESAPPSSQQWRIRARRKQPHPSRSVDIQDPDIQGVTFRMDTELDDSSEQCRLLITSKYSKELSKRARKPKMRTRTAQKSHKMCSSDEERELAISVSKSKICASCCTRKTPMWRDAEDGTPLCNACGIRYKKYRVRCTNCWHIPRKEGNSNSCCHKCGNFVKLTSALRKHTT